MKGRNFIILFSFTKNRSKNEISVYMKCIHSPHDLMTLVLAGTGLENSGVSYEFGYAYRSFIHK